MVFPTAAGLGVEGSMTGGFAPFALLVTGDAVAVPSTLSSAGVGRGDGVFDVAAFVAGAAGVVAGITGFCATGFPDGAGAEALALVDAGTGGAAFAATTFLAGSAALAGVAGLAGVTGFGAVATGFGAAFAGGEEVFLDVEAGGLAFLTAAGAADLADAAFAGVVVFVAVFGAGFVEVDGFAPAAAGFVDGFGAAALVVGLSCFGFVATRSILPAYPGGIGLL